LKIVNKTPKASSMVDDRSWSYTHCSVEDEELDGLLFALTVKTTNMTKMIIISSIFIPTVVKVPGG